MYQTLDMTLIKLGDIFYNYSIKWEVLMLSLSKLCLIQFTGIATRNIRTN